MRLKSAAFCTTVFLPNGGGSKADYVREAAYDIVQEGSYIRLRVKDKIGGQVISVPMPNVACMEFADSNWPEPGPAPVKK